MKKLMIGLVGAMAIAASAEVQSENIVGTIGNASISDNNFVTIPFYTVAYNTADIQQIQISDEGAGTIGWGAETFSIWEGIPTVVDGSYFIYCDASYDMTGTATTPFWGDDFGNPVSFSVAGLQGVVLGLTEGLQITFSGEVIKADKVGFVSIDGNNFSGNSFADKIDIQDIVISDDDAGTIGWGAETFSIWEGIPTVVEGSYFIYCDASYDMTGMATTPYWGNDFGERVNYTIESGKGFVLGLTEGLKVSIASPY